MKKLGKREGSVMTITFVGVYKPNEPLNQIETNNAIWCDPGLVVE